MTRNEIIDCMREQKRLADNKYRSYANKFVRLGAQADRRTAIKHKAESDIIDKLIKLAI